jgi:hypothetical protein
MALSSTENTPERLSQKVTDSDAEDVLEQTMRGIVDENDEAGLAARSQQFSLLSESFEMIETAKWPTKIASSKFSAFSIHEDMDRMPLSSEKRKSTDEVACEGPAKKVHLEAPPSPSTFDCDELFDDEFTQVKRPLPDAKVQEKFQVPVATTSFAGFSRANGGRIQPTGFGSKKFEAQPLRKNFFDGIEEEVKNLFGTAAINMSVPLSDASNEAFQGFQPVSKVFGAGTSKGELKMWISQQKLYSSLCFPEAAFVKPVEKPQSTFESSSKPATGFGLASGRVPKPKTTAKRDFFAGIDEEVQSLFGKASTDTLLQLGETSDEVFQGFQPVSKVFGASVKLKGELKIGFHTKNLPICQNWLVFIVFWIY